MSTRCTVAPRRDYFGSCRATPDSSHERSDSLPNRVPHDHVHSASTMTSSPELYYERYWSDGGYQPSGSLSPPLRDLFAQWIRADADCLDLGCGDGGTSGPWLQAHAASYIGVDVSTNAIRRPRALGLDARKVPATGSLPFADGSFDAVVCIEVLEHLVEPHLAASEALRVLTQGGRFLVSVPNVAYWRRRLEPRSPGTLESVWRWPFHTRALARPGHSFLHSGDP